MSFYKIKNGTSGFKDWSKRLLFISIGLSIKILSVIIIFLIAFTKTQNTKKGLKLEIENWELLAIGIALLACFITYLLGAKFKNDRDQLIEQIDNFFKK